MVDSIQRGAASEDLLFKRLVDPTTDDWRALMALYARTFEAAQRETEDGIVRNLRTPENHREGGHVVIAVGTDDRRCLGGIIFSWLSLISCGYVSYVFVEETSRRHGLGSQLLTQMRTYLTEKTCQGSHSVRGVFAEIERPQPDATNQQRMHFWRRNGVRPLAVEWCYPALRYKPG